MNFKIIWSNFSEKQLDEIYAYYEKESSPIVAAKIVNCFFHRTERGIAQRKKNPIPLSCFQKLQINIFGG